MNSKYLGNGVVTQIGIVVNDVERSAQSFAGFFGLPVPSWSWTGDFEKAGTVYRGSDTPARAKLAFLRLANLELELIEPDDSPSTWREHLDTNGEGVHHIAFVVEGMSRRLKALEAEGFATIQRGEYTGGRYAYVDTGAALKTVLELLENDPK